MIPRTSYMDSNVQIQVHSNKDFAQILYANDQDMGTRSLSLQPGFEYEVQVSVSGQMTTPVFEELSIDDRDCRLPYEIQKDSLQKWYTHGKCKYDCHVKKAYDVCQCIPWDFIGKIDDDIMECDIFGRTCFFHAIEQSIHDPEDICARSCEKECHKMTFKMKFQLC